MHEVVGAALGPQICFIGPFGVGKTTAAVQASATQVLMTEVSSSYAQSTGGSHLKSSTTVGLEIGEWLAPDGRRVCLVGTPGQERFDMIRRSALPRSDAVVLWLFGDHPEAVDNAIRWLDMVLTDVPARQLVVAVTRVEDDDTALEPFRKVVREWDDRIPVVAGDPRVPESVADVLETALVLCQPGSASHEEVIR